MIADHALSPGWGARGHKHAVDVMIFGRSIKATTVLDYGCGKGTLGKALRELKPGWSVTDYDPGMPKPWSNLPSGTYDLVTCTHVLEHVEPLELTKTLQTLDSYMRKGGFFVIPHGSAVAILPDGRNAHLIQESWDWWLSKLKEVWSDNIKMKPCIRGTTYLIRKR